MELSLGFLASHNGSNVEAILNAIERGDLNASPKVIISNNPDARVLEFGRNRNIPCYCFNVQNSKSPDDEILSTLQKHKVNLVVLAGYLKRIGHQILEYYSHRVTNIHPSLLPNYGGQGMYGINVHKAVIESSDTESGATIHLVTSEYDQGKILAQHRVPRFKNDTPETLAERVLKAEHLLYYQTLRNIQRGIINLDIK